MILLFATIGCEKFIEGYDIDPNKPSEVTPNLLLSVSEVAVFLTYSGQPARTTSIWMQQMTGTDFQMVDVNNYFMLEGDITNEWRTIYTNAQVNLNEIYSSVPPSRKASTATKSSTYGDFDDHTEATAPKFEPPPCEPRPAETAPTPSDEITKPISER